MIVRFWKFSVFYFFNFGVLVGLVSLVGGVLGVVVGVYDCRRYLGFCINFYFFLFEISYSYYFLMMLEVFVIDIYRDVGMCGFSFFVFRISFFRGY